mgnify:CR=1 FL=1
MFIQRKNSPFHYVVILAIFILSGCSGGFEKGMKTRIKGSFPALKNKTVTLSEFDINSAIPLDTTKISEDGTFKFTFRRKSPGFFLIKIDNRNYLTLILDKESSIEIFSDQQAIRKGYSVKGSPDSELYRQFEMFLEINREKVDSLSKSYSDYQRSSGFTSIKLDLDKTYQSVFENQRRYSMQFLRNHCNSLSSLLVVSRRFGERKILTEINDFEYYNLVDSCLTLKYPDNKHLLDFKKRLDVFRQDRMIAEKAERRLAVGNKAPDFGMQNASGQTVQLSSLTGRPVILYFWASWDAQSRKANKDLREILEKADNSKPAVYAVGLESYKEPWTEAIRADNIQDWIHVTDYLNIYSSARSLFNIPEKLPYFIYLDKDLIIRYKGNNLEELAKEINR